MPKYRQLHLKIIDSEDVNAMPDDFTRLTWVFLSLIVDSEGRGIDSVAGIRSKMYPYREDVSIAQMGRAIDWFADHKMIRRYCVGGRKYFFIPTWHNYQTGTDKEARSTIPAPELVGSSSGVIPEEVPANTIQDNTDSIQDNTKQSKKSATPPVEFPDSLNCEAFRLAWSEWEKFRAETKHKMTPSTTNRQLAMLEGFPVPTAIAMLNQSITNGWQGLFPIKANGNGNKRDDDRPSIPPDDPAERARLDALFAQGPNA
jgi:hypothetical protein